MASEHDVEHRQHGKFDCIVDEFAYACTLDGGEDTLGDVESPSGHLAKVTLMDPHEDGATWLDGRGIQHYGSRYLIVRENTQGFVQVISFDSEETREIAWQMASEAYFAWLDEDGEHT